MRVFRLIAGLTLALAVAAPIAAVAQQNPSQVQAAVKTAIQSAGLSMHQKMQIKPMVQQYQQQTANADAATKKSAQQELLKKIYGVMTPDQQAKFKASLKSSMVNANSSPQ